VLLYIAEPTVVNHWSARQGIQHSVLILLS